MTKQISIRHLGYDDEQSLREYFLGGGGRAISLSSWWTTIVELSLSGFAHGTDNAGIETRMVQSLDQSRRASGIAARLEAIGPHASTLRTYFAFELLPLSARSQLAGLGPWATLVGETKAFLSWCDGREPSIYLLESLALQSDNGQSKAKATVSAALEEAMTRMVAASVAYAGSKCNDRNQSVTASRDIL